MRSSLFSRRVLAAGVMCVCVVAGQGAAIAETITKANNGTATNTSKKTVNEGETLTVETGAELKVSGSGSAVSSGDDGGTATINNSGTIQKIGSSGRAIEIDEDGPTLTLKNNAGAVITSSGNDAIKTGKNTGYHIDNQGVISATKSSPDGGQALDLRDSDLAGSTLVNGSATNKDARIEAYGDDALRTGSNTTITNYGTIISFGTVNTSCPDYLEDQCKAGPDYGAQDGIDIGKNTNVMIDNYGTISGPRHGITADEDVTVYNHAGGVIVGRNGSGVGSDGNGTVYNWGTIRGDYIGKGKAFDHLGDGSTVDNGDGDGVDIDDKAYIVNYGQILGTGAGGVDSDGNPNGADGVAAGGGTVFNGAGGLIRGAQNGILVDDGAGGGAKFVTHITNDGAIVGTTGYGIRIDGAFNNTIDNAGSISGGTEAIHTGSGNDTLTLRSGSVVKGLMELGGGKDTFNYLQGGSAVFTFTSTAPEVVNAPGAVVVVSGTKVGIYNPSAQAAQAGAFSDLTSGISDMVFGRLESFGTGPQGSGTPSGFAGAMNLGAGSSRREVSGDSAGAYNASALAAWGNAFGTWTRSDGDGALSATSSRVGGFAAGYDQRLEAGTRVGIFFGGAYGTLNVDDAGEKDDATSVFGGLYLHKALPSFNLDANLTLGASDHESERTVANNLAAAGSETVTGDYWGFFVNPVVGVSSRGGFLGTPLLASARVGYAGAWTESYTEEGQAGALSVDSQTLHLFHARAEVKLPINFRAMDGGAFVVAPFAGVRGYTQVGDTDITGSIVGTDFAFDPGSDRSVGTAFVGVNAAMAVGEQGQAFLDVEGGRRTDETDELKAKAGVRWAW